MVGYTLNMKLASGERIILTAKKFFSIGGYTIAFPYKTGGGVFKVGFSGVRFFLTNKRIFAEMMLLGKELLNIPLPGILYSKVEKKLFVSFVRVGYKEGAEQKEVVFNFWKKEAEKWNVEMQKLISGVQN